jgi:hypothetical protein
LINGGTFTENVVQNANRSGNDLARNAGTAGRNLVRNIGNLFR